MVENSPWRIREVPRVVRSYRRARRVTTSVFLSARLGEIGVVGSEPTRVVGLTCISWIRELKF
jgi:hypothetical protein